MSDTPQVKCPYCGTSLPYTAAACPNCNWRVVEMTKPDPKLTAEERASQWSPEWANGQTPPNRGAVGGLIAAGVILVLMLFCFLSGKESPEERRARERKEEMRPLHEEMERKQREGKTREEAAREIVEEETRRQEQKKQMEQNK